MRTPDTVIEALKEWVAASNPGLVTKDDLARLEARVDELLELVDGLEERLFGGEEEELEEPDAGP